MQDRSVAVKKAILMNYLMVTGLLYVVPVESSSVLYSSTNVYIAVDNLAYVVNVSTH